MGKAFSYWRRTGALAVAETAFFGAQTIVTTIGVGLCALLLQGVYGVEEINRVPAIAATVLIAYVVVAGVGFAGNLIRIPPRIDSAQTAKIREFENLRAVVEIYRAGVDSPGVRRFNVRVTIVNPGPPSVFRKWAVEVWRPDGTFVRRFEPDIVVSAGETRAHPTLPHVHSTENVADQPVPTGAERDYELVTHTETLPAELFPVVGSRYRVSCRDARGVEVAGEYVNGHSETHSLNYVAAKGQGGRSVKRETATVALGKERP